MTHNPFDAESFDESGRAFFRGVMIGLGITAVVAAWLWLGYIAIMQVFGG